MTTLFKIATLSPFPPRLWLLVPLSCILSTTLSTIWHIIYLINPYLLSPPFPTSM